MRTKMDIENFKFCGKRISEQPLEYCGDEIFICTNCAFKLNRYAGMVEATNKMMIEKEYHYQ